MRKKVTSTTAVALFLIGAAALFVRYEDEVLSFLSMVVIFVFLFVGQMIKVTFGMFG